MNVVRIASAIRSHAGGMTAAFIRSCKGAELYSSIS